MPFKYYKVGNKIATSGGKILKLFFNYDIISAGPYHSLYINSTKKENWAWGNGNFGQLGNNSILSRRTPVSIHGNKKTFCKISGGSGFSISIDNKGQVWGWGYNAHGNIGNNSITSKCTPVSIHGNKKTFCNITCGSLDTNGIDLYGQVWGWGYNGYGNLGDNTTTSRCTPVSIHGNKKTFCKISNGVYHSIAVEHNGQIWGWGYNLNGQIGDNSITSRLTPVSIHGNKKTFCQISSGKFHTVSIDKNGQIWTWGTNPYGNLGNNSTSYKLTPVSIHGNKKTFCQISGGYHFTVGIDYKGQVWTWGINAYGVLGDNTYTNKCTPISIKGDKKTFCFISTGDNFTLAIDYNSKIWAWGDNSVGQIGNITTIQKTPATIGKYLTLNKVGAGEYHSLSIDNNGQIWSWGYNSNGQIGDNSLTSRLTPVSILGTKKTFCQISTGTSSLAIDKNGQVWGWGNNDRFQIGDDSSTSQRTPVSIHGNKKTFCQIANSNVHSMGLDYNGQVWGWGYNGYGQLGDNTNDPRRTPVSIHGNKKTFCNITNGIGSSFGIDYNGQVWSWGFGVSGILGNNTISDERTPVSIHGIKKTFCHLNSSLGNHILSIDKYGQIWSWGANGYGVLGDNTITNKCTPVSIHGIKKTFCRISAGQSHSNAIDQYGQIWGWGYNSYGQLGDNSTSSRRTPVSILGNKKTFCEIKSYNIHTLALDKNGYVWGWGYNIYGQIGNYNTKTPVRVYNL